MSRNRPHARSCTTLAGIAVLFAGIAIGPPAVAVEDDNTLTIMTKNVYEGSSLDPILEATTETDFTMAVARVYATVQ